MLDINWIRANRDAADAALKHRKNVPFSASELIAIDDARKAVIGRLEEAQATRNALSKQIGQAKAQKDEARAAALMEEVSHLKDIIQQGEAERREAEEKLRQALLIMPNLPKDEVPEGEDEADNVEYFGPNGNAAIAAKARAAKPSFSFKPKEHFETGEALGMMDFEIAAKLSGSRFVVLKSGLARMERAIGQFMLDLHTNEHGYMEVQPPLLVKDDALYGTGQLPKFEEDLFKTSRNASMQDARALALKAYQRFLTDEPEFAASREPANLAQRKQRMNQYLKDEFDRTLGFDLGSSSVEALLDTSLALYLIPTAEVPLTNLVRESILAEEELPLRFTALTPCFRSEAGSAGRDTRGMLRQHQFNKVELVSITTPEQSADEHERMLASAEAVLQKLGIHYRVMLLSTADMGFGAQKTYDIEVWLPGQNAYREISSCSVCGDFQARRMEARFKGKDGKIRHVHTLNGSALAVGRALIAVMENYQQEDGSIAVPDVLQPYMGGLKSIGAPK
ncbi:MAG: serine--tRNA ligase [Devosia nanyangense]|uniref:Serine--tRNA ligase n=1 Tax=Devosia nanyangense TaxID=1228055 RepID=A0A933L3R0_9HYPH|nr:serine--tRNA ligase [Devosia nanyangense]